jgi:hypothetical protein
MVLKDMIDLAQESWKECRPGASRDPVPSNEAAALA